MKKLFTAVLILVICTLSTFAQPTVTLNKDLTTQTQNIVVGNNGLSDGGKVVYDISYNTNITVTDLEIQVYGPITSMKLQQGSLVLASKDVGNVVHFGGLNINIPANTKSNFEVHLSYAGIGIPGGYSSGSTAQIQLNEISYTEGSMGKSMSIYTTPSPFIALVSELPKIEISGRPVGAETYAETQINIIGYGILDRAQLKITYMENHLMPFDFWPGKIFYYSNWIYPSASYNGNELNFAAVGEPTSFYNGINLGTFLIFVSNNTKNNMFSSNIDLFDGTNHWQKNISPFKIIELARTEYGNLKKDGKRDINDARPMFDLVGTTPSNDTSLVKADLTGDGKILTWDVILFLRYLMNQSSMNEWPIFGYNNGAVGKIIPKDPITVNWKKLPNGQYGAFASEKVTNGDFFLKDNTKLSGHNGMFKQIGNNAYSVNINPSLKDPIFTAKTPTEFSGMVNEGRQIIVSPVVTTAVEEETATPTDFKLEQNYPNPFNPSTTINYSLPTAGFVTLKVYDIIGREIAELVKEEKAAGLYQAKFDATGLASGMYIYKISTGSFTQSKKMILTK
ncbi:MAG: T9SS type A sorting domain-containing protein [Burkholderiales bacterium]|nr:T9SS type A sorting domain-containing protein [Burkholderiales bacterium]